MSRLTRLVVSVVLLEVLLVAGTLLARWKGGALRDAEAAGLPGMEPAESVTVAGVTTDIDRPTTTAIGTVLALRSVTLRNELPGTVRDVRLVPGQIVEAGDLLIALDVAVEQAELTAQQARADLAERTLARLERLVEERATSATTVEQARATREVALAEMARTRAIIERKTIRAPFRAKVGLADLHLGQYLDTGTELTTLQAVSSTVHVDFAVPETVAARLRAGNRVRIAGAVDATSRSAEVIAVDARVDATTRNATVRARLTGRELPAPGASVPVLVPTGPDRRALAIPATALRKGPDGDHVFVVATDDRGQLRAHLRRIEIGAADGDRVLVERGIEAGERVATSGSFKLRDGMLVVAAEAPSVSQASGK